MNFFVSNYNFFFFSLFFGKKTVQNLFFSLFSSSRNVTIYLLYTSSFFDQTLTSLDMFRHVLGSGFVKKVGNDQGFERMRREEEKKDKDSINLWASFCLFIAIHNRLLFLLFVLIIKRDKKWAQERGYMLCKLLQLCM